MGFFERIRIWYRKRLLDRCIRKMMKKIEDHMLDDFLELLLKAMALAFLVDKDFRKNIEDFRANYVFKSRDGGIETGIQFRHGEMEVKEEALRNSSVTVVFKDGETLKDFLFSGNQDIFKYLLENSLSYTGNLNYILKFGYMAKHLQLQFGL